ncbi:hypothetical protein SLA2020_002970 [Shorea laevis]
MDQINHTKLPNQSWDLEISMDNPNILRVENLLINPLWPSYAPQTRQIEPSNSSSAQIPSPSTPFLENTTEEEEPEEELGAMKEMMYKIAAMQPVDIDPAAIQKPKRRNVRISNDPQSVAARHRRERISEKIRILQRLVPGGTKMDTASMLDEAIRYVKFLKRQIRQLQSNQQTNNVNSWQVTPTKPLGGGSFTSTSLETPLGFRFGGGNNGGNPLCFNNHEVISD